MPEKAEPVIDDLRNVARLSASTPYSRLPVITESIMTTEPLAAQSLLRLDEKAHLSARISSALTACDRPTIKIYR